ncbi:unnamed protein product [Oikopleura dioica]|uniref:Glycogen [starch] synthase n=1 Tax=Oikopleura dioica TaxID=34765 RepID=E4YJ05_OIKDI|nr:unnamed protein product [Oikopleura dioica]
MEYFTFEFSLEVANKVGGIYQVIKSKAPVSVDELGYSKYVLFGAKKNDRALRTEVEQCELQNPIMQKTVEAMRERGIGVTTGKWLIESVPQVVLFDIPSVAGYLDGWRREFADKTKISGPLEDVEFNDTILYGFTCAWFIGEWLHQYKLANEDRIPLTVCHFHEWLASVGMIMARIRKLNVATIFTTHATLLGRYLCADPSFDFYTNLQTVNVDYEAGRRQIYHRYCIERAAASLSHVFTAVSQITADEAEHLLKRKPDVITPNGLNVKRWSAPHEFQSQHQKSKEKIEQFMQGHFYGHLDFDLDNTIYMFTAGRYEYRNKGIDLFIEALARLNKKLMDEQSDVTVAAFMIFNGKTNSFNVESLEGQSQSKALIESTRKLQERIGQRIYQSVTQGHIPEASEIIGDEDMYEIKSKVYGAEGRPLPPITTHNLVNDAKDPVLSKLRACKLHNNWWDRVKVIFHPEFLKPTNPLLPMDYMEFARGCHLGVFPSYYEPWGYTPAECTVMGIPSVTTNLSGYGCWMEEHIENAWQYGTYIIDRRYPAFEKAAEDLADNMLGFCKQTRRQRIIQRNRTERLSDFLDWKNLGRYYTEARKLALARVLPDNIQEEIELLHKSKMSSFKRAPSLANLSIAASPFNSRPASRHASHDDDEDEEQNNNEPIEDIYDDDGTLMFSKDMNDVEEGIKNTRVY